MSIPERIWRVAKGRWTLAQEKIGDVQARADAYQELADALKEAPPIQATQTAEGTTVLPPTPSSSNLPTGQHDPMQAAYALMQVAPGCDLAALEQAYEARKNEIHPEYYAEGAPERAALQARRAAVDAAYQKLRDALNPVETRFERLEF